MTPNINSKTVFFLEPSTQQSKPATVSEWHNIGQDSDLYLEWLESKQLLHQHLIADDAEFMRQKVMALEESRQHMTEEEEELSMPLMTMTAADEVQPFDVAPLPIPKAAMSTPDEVLSANDNTYWQPEQSPPHTQPEVRRKLKKKKKKRFLSRPPEHPEMQQEEQVPQQNEEEERNDLLERLDKLRLKFKNSAIPQDIESKETHIMRAVLHRNIVQLKRARTLAMMKLGMAAGLIVVEFVLAHFCRIDMSRFMKWHYANVFFVFCFFDFVLTGDVCT